MAPTDDNLLRRLLATFKVEAREHIDAISAGLLEMERAATEDEKSSVLDTTFRAAHSLKGAARTVNVRDMETVCQSLENVFAALRRKDIAWSAELFDLLHQAVRLLGTLLEFTDASPATPRPAIADVLRLLQSAATRKSQTASPAMENVAELIDTTSQVAPNLADAVPVAKRSALDTVRVDTAKLDAVLLQAEELLAAKLSTARQAARLRQCRVEPTEWKKRWTKLSPDLRSIRKTLDADATANPQWQRVMEFLDWSRGCIDSLDGGLLEVAKVADHEQRAVGVMVDNLLDEMKKVVMQPFATVLDVLPRTVRELSREQGKIVELAIRGEDVEIDRRILEELKDPLIHLMRNSIDHGIEAPEERKKAGKSQQGALSVSIAARDGSNVEMLVSDDGRGIDAAAVAASAVRHSVLSQAEAKSLGEQESLSLIFQSGISTSPIITDISGRGLGLAIVKEKVDKLNGSLSVQSEVGKGTTFRIVLPVTLARFRGVLIRASRNLFVLPTSSVECVVRVGTKDIKTVENRETILLNGSVTALSRLADVLELPVVREAVAEPAHLPAVVLTYGNQRIAFLIDEVIDEQEVLVKRLGKQLARVRNIVGATVLGNGQVVPILNVSDLIDSAVQGSAAGVKSVISAPAGTEKKQQSVLVAEDSITSRVLIKNILETAGYRVETAVDGMDGLTKLRSGDFDLVVSDVEMPRMDGFGLTTQLRADKKLNHIPVILVTALNSREDRERGVDAGANAYIVKSAFDQSSLLEVVKRLI